jgi:hypothetical protein
MERWEVERWTRTYLDGSVRNVGRNACPFLASCSSHFFVQSQSQQAHGSVPFKSRQFLFEWAFFTLNRSKYFSQ